MHPDRWEHGSDYASVDLEASSDCSEGDLPNPWGDGGQFYGCGRDALRDLAEHGITSRGWRRLWIPSYFCEDVVEALRCLSLDLMRYPDGPWSREPCIPLASLRAGDACLLVNFFGTRSCLNGDPESRPAEVEFIEDHTHDPWSTSARRSQASYAIASLRKTLPVADGGVLWSPTAQGLPSPPPLSDAHLARATERRKGMDLKSAYLAGEDVSKRVFRAHLTSSEQSFATTPPSGMTPESLELLERLPLGEIRRRRAENHAYFVECLARTPGVEVFQPEAPSSDACPLALVLLLPTEAARDELRKRCIDARIYPAILWSSPDPHAVQADTDFSSRMLALHCDMRYEREDLERVVKVIGGVIS